MAQVLDIIIKGKDEASGAFKGIESSIGGIGKAIGLLAGAGGILAGFGVALGKLAIDAAPLEQISAAFTGLAQSAGTSSIAMLAALEQGSNGMIAQRDLMTSFNKAAQLVGVDFAQKLPDAMKYLGKVAGATGQDMSFLLDSLVVGVGRMSPMILDNLGIQVSLEAATARAAQMFGVEASELTKAQQQAGLMNVVLEKLQQNTAAMPDAAGSATAGIAQFSATMKNLADQVGVGLLPVFTPFLNGLAQLAQTALPLVVAQFQQFAANMTATLGPAMILIGDAWSRIVTAFGGSASQFTLLDAAMMTLKGVLDALVIGVQTFAIAMQGLAVVVEFIIPLWQQFVTFLQENTAIQVVVTTITGLVEIITRIPEAIEIALGLWEQLTTILTELTPFQAIIAVLGEITGAFNAIGAAISGLIDLWGQFANAVSSFSLPDIITPGSPTPMENGLVGIAKALQSLNNIGMPDMGMSGAGGGNFNVSVVPQSINLDGKQIGQALSPRTSTSKMGGVSPL